MDHNQLNVFHNKLGTFHNQLQVYGIKVTVTSVSHPRSDPPACEMVPNDLAVCFDHADSCELDHFDKHFDLIVLAESE